MQQWGLTSYVYAPKDDCKHRAYWRQSYTVEEAEHLASLVAMARSDRFTFAKSCQCGVDMRRIILLVDITLKDAILDSLNEYLLV